MARQISDTSLVGEGRSESLGKASQTTRHHSRQAWTELAALERVDYQIDNPKFTVHAPGCTSFNFVRKLCRLRRSSLAE